VNQVLRRPLPTDVEYPESDGEPMADNTKQLVWIVVLYSNLAALFRHQPDVFVGGNQFWYPVEGENELKLAPDVYVVFGRPKGHRPSWKQWEEDNVPMTVVLEVLSPRNRGLEMINKQTFYEDHGVAEYYLYDPEENCLQVYLRQGEMLRRVYKVDGFTSPRLGIRFDLSGPEMVVFLPSGRRFLTFEEVDEERLRLEAEQAEEHRQRLVAEERADQAQQRADQAQQRADQAQQRADQAQQRADQAQQRSARLAELSRKARHQQATQAELEELQRLEEQASLQ
jgi:Uma2 family endonuclease